MASDKLRRNDQTRSIRTTTQTTRRPARTSTRACIPVVTQLAATKTAQSCHTRLCQSFRPMTPAARKAHMTW